jgi:hypothetical protein
VAASDEEGDGGAGRAEGAEGEVEGRVARGGGGGVRICVEEDAKERDVAGLKRQKEM